MRDMRYVLTEEKYDMAKERHHATLFATGNGYMGVRGSFEEYSYARRTGAVRARHFR